MTRYWIFWPRTLLLIALIASVFNGSIQAQSIIRLGVIDQEDGPLARGALLAAQQINAEGGVVGADRSVFELRVVATSPEYPGIAAANMAQANVIAIIGPGNSRNLRPILNELAGSDVPIFTSAAADSVLVQGQNQNTFRSTAPETTRSRALAAYLINGRDVRTLTTVQLDAESTGSLIGFAAALAELGVGASNIFYDQARIDLSEISGALMNNPPDAVSLYGPPTVAAQTYNLLRDAGYGGIVSYNQTTDPGFLSFVSADLLPGIVSVTNWSFAAQDAQSRRFLLDYVDAFGAIPDGSSAASYDAVGLLAEAYRRPGRLSDNLAAIRSFEGVQGPLTPARLLGRETSHNVMVTELNEYGTPNVVARFEADELVAREIAAPFLATATPEPTSTPAGFNLTIQSTIQNVRSGPGLNFDVIGQIPRGTQARILGATDDYSWYVIDFQGQLGWLAAYLVVTFGNRNLVPIIQPPPSPTPPATATPAPAIEPDLVIVNAYPRRITLDQPAVVNVIIENRGLSAAGPFAVATSFLPGGRYAGVNVASLSGGQQTTIQLQQMLSGASGPQSIVIVADLNQQVYEGAAGEANNQIFRFNYIADRAVLSSGTWTLATGSVDLDGSGQLDLSWTGNDLVAQNGGGLYVMTGFGSLEDVHYDAVIPDLAAAGALNIDLLRNTVIGLVTPEGNRGALQAGEISSGGAITFAYRMYR